MRKIKRPTRLPARFRKTPWAVAIAAALLPAGSAGVNSPGAAVAGEFAVNQGTGGHQRWGAVAVDADGDFVVVWSIAGDQMTPVHRRHRILARRFNAAAVPLGDEFQVSLDSDSYSASEGPPDIAMDPDGDFVVTWNRQEYAYDINRPPYGISYRIVARRYDPAGTPLGLEFPVSPDMMRWTGAPSVAMDAAGDFVVVWPGDGPDNSTPVFARRHGAHGGALDGEFPVSQTATGMQSAPDVAMDADGDFVVAWIGYVARQEGDVLVRRFSAGGAALGDQLQANAPTTGVLSAPAASMDADGDFVIAWRNDYFVCGGAYCYDLDEVTARRYDATGQALGEQIIVSSVGMEPALAQSSSGDFVVTWRDRSQPDVYGQRYGSAGAPQGAAFLLPTCHGGSQSGAAAALDADGDLLAAWEGSGPSCQPTASLGVFARQFGGAEDVDLHLTMADDADPVPAGGPLSYTLSVVNQHPVPALSGDPARDAYLGAIGTATGLLITFTNPSGTSVAPDAGSGADWTCTGPSCRYTGKLAPGAATSLQFSLIAPAYGGAVTASASLTGNQFDADYADNVASESTFIDGPPPPEPPVDPDPPPDPVPQPVRNPPGNARADNGGSLSPFITLLTLLAALSRRRRLRRAGTP